MALQIKRSKLYQEELELIDADGSVVHTLHIVLDPDAVAVRLSKEHINLVRALQAVKNVEPGTAPEDALNVVEQATKSILNTVFGMTNAQIITGFYNDRYLEINREVMPLITSSVIPEIRRMARENKKTTVTGYHRPKHGLLWKK